MNPRVAAVVPVPTVTGSAAVSAVVATLAVALRPTPLPALTVHLAQLALAGVAAFMLDDAAAELTGVVPPPLWRRRASRVVVGLVAVTIGWTVVLVVSVGASRSALTLEVGVLVVLSLAASSLVATRGDSEPGAMVAPAVVLAGLAAMLVGGLLGRTLFVSDAHPAVPGLATAWAAAGVLAAVLLVGSSRDPALRRGRRAGARGARRRSR